MAFEFQTFLDSLGSALDWLSELHREWQHVRRTTGHWPLLEMFCYGLFGVTCVSAAVWIIVYGRAHWTTSTLVLILFVWLLLATLGRIGMDAWVRADREGND